MSLEWVCIDAQGVLSREPEPHPGCVVAMLWRIWQTLPSEHRNTMIMQAKIICVEMTVAAQS